MAFTRATLLLGAALAIGSAQGALAADLGSYGGSMKDAPMAMPYAASGPSWYARIDGGYSSYDDPTVTENGIYDLTETGIDSSWSVGGGIGRYFGNGFRGDVTVEQRFETDVSASLPDPAATLPGTRQFGLKSTVVLANLYYDFDTGSRFTPYLGVGLGVTRNKTTEGTVDDCGCVTGTIESGSDTHVAGAAMAGFTTRLRGGETTVQGGSIKDGPVTVSAGRGLYLDVGYRFLYLGEVATGPVSTTYAVGPPVSQDPAVEDIHAHEFRFGLRYDIN